jgi:hypothetical protein
VVAALRLQPGTNIFSWRDESMGPDGERGRLSIGTGQEDLAQERRVSLAIGPDCQPRWEGMMVR